MQCCHTQKTKYTSPSPTRTYGYWVVAGSIALIAAIILVNRYTGSTKNQTQSAAISQTVLGGATNGQSEDDTSSHHGSAQKASPQVADALVGKPIPQFSLADANGNVYTLETLRGKKVVLFFNEGLMCYPSCWQQIASFGSDARFKNADTVALSVVVDSKNDWQQKAVKKMPELANAITLFDQDKAVSQKLGMLVTSSSMHHGSLPGHTYLLVDANGILRSVVDDPQMAMHNDHLAEELAKL